MTYEDLKRFAARHNTTTDAFCIKFKDYFIYPDGSIYLNIHTFDPVSISFRVCVSKDRTPRQMFQFIESLL